VRAQDNQTFFNENKQLQHVWSLKLNLVQPMLYLDNNTEQTNNAEEIK